MKAYMVPRAPITEPFFRTRLPPPPKLTAAQKREEAAPGHLAKLRLLPCCVCGRVAPSEPHHLRHGRGSMTKAPDSKALPLYWEHHQGREGVHSVGAQYEVRWFLGHGIRCFDLAAALFATSHSLIKMLKVLREHREAGRAETY